jgi:hypothetical protein
VQFGCWGASERTVSEEDCAIVVSLTVKIELSVSFAMVIKHSKPPRLVFGGRERGKVLQLCSFTDGKRPYSHWILVSLGPSHLLPPCPRRDSVQFVEAKGANIPATVMEDCPPACAIFGSVKMWSYRCRCAYGCSSTAHSDVRIDGSPGSAGRLACLDCEAGREAADCWQRR